MGSTDMTGRYTSRSTVEDSDPACPDRQDLPVLHNNGERSMVKVGVNGFGRIGRNVVRAALAAKLDIEFVAVNDLTDSANLAYLLKYDSVHGTIPNQIGHTATGVTIDGR